MNQTKMMKAAVEGAPPAEAARPGTLTTCRTCHARLTESLKDEIARRNDMSVNDDLGLLHTHKYDAVHFILTTVTFYITDKSVCYGCWVKEPPMMDVIVGQADGPPPGGNLKSYCFTLKDGPIYNSDALAALAEFTSSTMGAHAARALAQIVSHHPTLERLALQGQGR
jgi:hypothetical protein